MVCMPCGEKIRFFGVMSLLLQCEKHETRFIHLWVALFLGNGTCVGLILMLVGGGGCIESSV